MPEVSILLTTYNRSELLKGAIASILGQTFDDFELVIMDDASTDNTSDVVGSFDDPRIVYVRATENIGQRFGDTPIVGKGLREHCRASKWLHINDDDEFMSPDLLSRQAKAFQDHPSLAFVIGGVAQKYPEPIEPFLPNAPYLENILVQPDTVFVKGVYPSGFIKSREFLSLFADDPPNRNIVCGAMMFDLNKVPLAKYFGDSFAAQAGPAMVCGAAMHGDVFYIDEPMLLNRVERNCLSFKGTQADHFRQCLASVEAAFSLVERDEELKEIRERMMKAYFRAYLGNKIATRLGYFERNPLGDISSLMLPMISRSEFVAALEGAGIPLSPERIFAIEIADKSPQEIETIGVIAICEMCS